MDALLETLSTPVTNLKFDQLKLHQPYKIARFDEFSGFMMGKRIESISANIYFPHTAPNQIRKIFLPARFRNMREHIPELNTRLANGRFEYSLTWLGPCGPSNRVEIKHFGNLIPGG